MTPQRILFVCTGNICRSPTAEGVLMKMAQARGWAGRIQVASAGLDGWHVGEPPDPRSQAHALRRGVDLSAQRARRVERSDFDHHDWVIAMDAEHHARLTRLCPRSRLHTLRQAKDFSDLVPAGGVPDPYYGGERGFEEMLDMVEAVCLGVLAALEAPRP